ncbi:MAG: carboxyl transferase domain-containing protein, partial [Deltaproteobacteria bacterium]|nr:carboxyl transferase domain-containing protein [Deltaproteobacteria bacterium]
MTPEINKRLSQIELNVQYLLDIKEGAEWGNLGDLMEKVQRLKEEIYDRPEGSIEADLAALEETISFLEDRAEKSLTPDEIVRIVRNPQRITLQNILENVYDSYTELGGMEDCNIDPSMVVAKATISRRVKGHVYVHQVMVIGHEKGHGEEYRNGGCTRPWGNEKAMRYMKVAETEGIPVHLYVFTPGAFPIEDYPGAAQQIARNLYALAKLRVPIVSLISEGGSGGAEALGMSDIRLMLSHGYYSVISPEGAAAIEGKIKEREKVPKDLLTFCAKQLSITAQDNLRLKTIDRVVQEPVLGARRDDFAFLRQLRYEMIRATDEVVLKTKSFRTFRAYAIKQEKAAERNYEFDIYIRWELTEGEEERLLRLRSLKYRKMGQGFYNESVTWPDKVFKKTEDAVLKSYYGLRYGLIRHHHKQVKKVIEEVSGEGSVFLRKISSPLISAYDFIANSAAKKQLRIMAASSTASGAEEVTEDWGDTYVSPLANEDRTVSCPNARKYGCLDLWVPDLYGEF